MNSVKKHFEEEAAVFDANIVKLIPHYSQMLEALVSSIPFDSAKPLHVIDLGSGTGTVSKLIAARFPHASITCLDIAENMLNLAEQKLSDCFSVSFVAGDFSDYRFGKTYDVVVSSLALHHLPDDLSKQEFFQRIFAALAPGGIFLNADVVLGSSPEFQAVYMMKWREFILKSITAEEADAVWFPKYEEEDRPAVLSDQLDWLRQAGFRSVEVVWKYYNFAVYGGRKID